MSAGKYFQENVCIIRMISYNSVVSRMDPSGWLLQLFTANNRTPPGALGTKQWCTRDVR